jgi:hypothetical protein
MNENIDTSRTGGTSKLHAASRVTRMGDFTYQRRRLLLQKLTVALSTDQGMIRLLRNPKDRHCVSKSQQRVSPERDESSRLLRFTGVHRPDF